MCMCELLADLKLTQMAWNFTQQCTDTDKRIDKTPGELIWIYYLLYSPNVGSVSIIVIIPHKPFGFHVPIYRGVMQSAGNSIWPEGKTQAKAICLDLLPKCSQSSPL